MNTVRTAAQVKKYFGGKTVMPLSNLFASDFSKGSFGTLVQSNKLAVTKLFDTLLAVNADLGGLISASDFGSVVNKAFGFYRIKLFRHLIKRKTAQTARPFAPSYTTKLYSGGWSLRKRTNYLTALLAEADKKVIEDNAKFEKAMRTRWWFSDKNIKRLQMEKDKLEASEARRRRTAGGAFVPKTRPALGFFNKGRARKTKAYTRPFVGRNSDGLPLFQDGTVN